MKDPAFLFYSSDFLVGTMFMTNEQKGKYITLLCMQHQKGHLTKDQITKACDSDKEILDKFVVDDEGKYYNERLDVESNKRKKYCESRRKSFAKSEEDDVRIYFIRDNITTYTKIGSSVNPDRRFNELCNQKNPGAVIPDKNRDYTMIFTSKIVKRSIEKVIHKKYKGKKVMGEWFSLSEEELETIKVSYNLHTEAHTEVHTEERLINENANEDKDTTKDINKDKEKSPFDNFWKAYPRKMSKGQAEKTFKKLNPDEQLLKTIISAIEKAKKTADWKKDNGQFIPYPSTWLNSKGWLDEIPEATNEKGFTERDYEESDIEDLYLDPLKEAK